MARPVSATTRGVKYLALPPASGELPESGGIVFSSVAPPRRKQIEHAGHVYQERVRARYLVNPADATQSPDAPGSSESEKPAKSTKPGTAATGSELQRKLATDGDDLYALLELGDKRWHATADDIKKSFRRISLLYHPDKLRHKVSHLGEEAIAETESHFKKVMKAHEILSDKKKRAAYDSIDDVDDLIPTESEVNDNNFYQLLGERFGINSRWSVSDRVPTLGNENTPMDEVHKFYNFWYSFKTWRDFSFDLEYDTDQAECREEKRWMDRQNAKRIKARKLKESERIRELTDVAYKKDPRIRKEKDDNKKKKEAAKEARRKEKENEENRKREEEEKARLEEEQRVNDEKEKRAQAKREKDAARKLMRKARQKLRGVARDLELSDVDSVAAIEKMCSEGDVRTIEAFADELLRLASVQSGEDTGLVPSVNIANITEIVEEALVAGLKSVVPEAKKAGVNSCSKSHGTGDTNKSLVSNQENVPNGTSDAKSNSGWTQEEMSLLAKGLRKFPGGTKNRWERLAHYLGTRSADEVLKQVNMSRTSSRASKTNGSRGRTLQNSEPAKQDVANFGSSQKPKSKEAPSSRAPASAVPNKLSFSSSQQSELETAMKRFAKEPSALKWVKIAEHVSGRSAEECEERVQELRSYYKAKKSGV